MSSSPQHTWRRSLFLWGLVQLIACIKAYYLFRYWLDWVRTRRLRILPLVPLFFLYTMTQVFWWSIFIVFVFYREPSGTSWSFYEEDEL